MSNNPHPTREPTNIVRPPPFLSATYRNADNLENSRKSCNHSFSGAAIREYLSHGPKNCPATGCNKKITLADLKSDKGLERRVKEHARRAAMRDDEEDVDAEIID